MVFTLQADGVVFAFSCEFLHRFFPYGGESSKKQIHAYVTPEHIISS